MSQPNRWVITEKSLNEESARGGKAILTCGFLSFVALVASMSHRTKGCFRVKEKAELAKRARPIYV